VSGSRFEKNTTQDLLTFLAGAVRRRSSPFAVTEAVLEYLARGEAPPPLGAALVTFHATLAGEVRDALEGHTSPVARFFQASVPAELPDKALEVAWRHAAHALSKLRQFERAPSAKAVEALKALVADEEVLRAAQVALATATPAQLKSTRWFLPLLVLDGSEASLDALLPHLDAALSGDASVAKAFKPLLGIAAPTPGMSALVHRLASASRAVRG